MEGILKMTQENKRKYLAQLERQRIRDEMELEADESDSFAEVFETFTDMEKIVFIHLEYRLSHGFTHKHLGISRQRYHQILGNIRNKITNMEVEK